MFLHVEDKYAIPKIPLPICRYADVTFCPIVAAILFA